MSRDPVPRFTQGRLPRQDRTQSAAFHLPVAGVPRPPHIVRLIPTGVACGGEPNGAYAGASEPAVWGTEWHGAAYRFTALMFMNSGSFDHRW